MTRPAAVDRAYVGTSTFLCEGCGRRYPTEQVGQDAEALAQGDFVTQRYVRGRRVYVLIPMVCSLACAQRLRVRTLKQWWKVHRDTLDRTYEDLIAFVHRELGMFPTACVDLTIPTDTLPRPACPWGHAITPETTRFGTKGEHVCRLCARAWVRRDHHHQNPGEDADGGTASRYDLCPA